MQRILSVILSLISLTALVSAGPLSRRAQESARPNSRKPDHASRFSGRTILAFDEETDCKFGQGLVPAAKQISARSEGELAQPDGQRWQSALDFLSEF